MPAVNKNPNRSRLLLAAASLLLAVNSSLYAACACTNTAESARKMGLAEAMADYWQATGTCFNIVSSTTQQQCRADAQDALDEANQEVALQNGERLKICTLLGEAPYAPVITPSQFVNFSKVLSGSQTLTANRYFPLKPGTAWEYIGFDEEGETTESIRVEVLRKTKLILGVQCIVVRDRVWEIEDDRSTLVEDTLDWYAQDLKGNVWYFGELSQEFENGQLVSLEGSWQAGQDGAKPGIIMFASPQAGKVYRQEFLIGEAEDVAKVIGTNQVSVRVPYGTFSTNVLQTKEWSPLEPGVFEYKFYAPGIGLVLETNPDTGEELVLVEKTNG